MIELEIKVDYQAVQRNLENKLKEFDSRLNTFITDLLMAGENFVKMEAPIRTGVLAGATRSTKTNNGGIIWVDANIAPHFRPVYFGRRAMDIYPTHKQALFWPGARHPVKHVHQKSRAPNKYVDRAEAKLAQAAQYRMDAFLKWLEA